MAADQREALRTLVADVAAAYFANSHVGVGEISSVIEQIAKGLSAVGEQNGASTSPPEDRDLQARRTPVQIRKSITPEVLISFEDGRPYKTLRRHLALKGLTPEQYREKWGLPHDYPMVSATYSAARSQLAKQVGLGNLRKGAAPAPQPASRRGRRSGSTAPSQP